jgi:hypothetical protein
MRVLLAAVLSLLLLPAAASAAPEEAAGRDCFLSANWRGWSVASEGDALYLRMQGDDVFRVQLTPGTRVRRHAGEFLVNRVRGSNWICSALDLDLAIADGNGFARPLIAVGLRKLSPEEVAAIAPEDRPR